VLCDPANTLYFNTFYAESAALYAAWLLLAALMVASAPSPALRGGWTLLVGLGAAALAVSKVQHVLTPLLVLAVLLGGRWIGLRVARPVLIALALGALVGGGIQAAQMRAPHTATMGHANLINALFDAVLPSSEDPAGLVAKLGLPVECARYSGESWFTPGMAEGGHCREAFELKRTRFLAVLLREPGLLAKLWIGGVARMRPWVPKYLGLVEGEEGGALPTAQPSLGVVLDLLAPSWWLASMLLLLPLGVAATRTLARRGEHAGATVMLTLGALPGILLLIAVLGDGYGDTAKQSHLATAMLVAGWICIGTVGAATLAAALRRGSR
jgi:hypothetical protein